jgi:hypothetical protein
LWRFVPPHFFAPVKMLRIFPYRAQKNVKLQPGALGEINIELFEKW